jgi:hypothetical protein
MGYEVEGGRSARRSRARHALAVAAALPAGAVLAVLAFARVEWQGGPVVVPRFDLREAVRRLPEHLGWLVPFMLVAASLPALRSLVWRAVHPVPAPSLADAYHATALGALVHNAVPGKLGPVAAAWILARTARRPFAPAFGSQLVSKLLEMGAVVVAGALAAASLRPGAAVARVVIAGAVLFLALASSAAATAVAAPRAARRLARRFPRAGAALSSLGEGIAGAGSVRRLAAALGLAALPALASAAAYAIPLRVLGAASGPAGGAVVVAVITFGQLTPGLPIGAAVYWSLAAWAARQLGATPEHAAVLAVLSHAGMVSANLAVGAVSAVVRRGALAEVLRRRREVERLARVGAETPTRTPT